MGFDVAKVPEFRELSHTFSIVFKFTLNISGLILKQMRKQLA